MTQDREPMREGTLDPINIGSLNLAEFHAADDNKVRWSGGFFSYGGAGSSLSAPIYFEIAPGERLGGHIDTVEGRSSSLGVAGSCSSTMALARWPLATWSCCPRGHVMTCSTQA